MLQHPHCRLCAFLALMVVVLVQFMSITSFTTLIFQHNEPVVTTTRTQPITLTWPSLFQGVSGESGWSMIVNIIPRGITAVEHDDITLLTHASVDRFEMLLDEVKRWGGPVSAAVYLSKESDLTHFLSFVHVNELALRNAAFHAYVERNTTLDYPHNILRNLAMDQLETDYFIALDVDFVTERDCHSRLVNLIRSDSSVKQALQSKTFLVLPAFESFSNNATIPESKQQVLSMVESGQVFPFHVKSFPPGHGPTDFDRWYRNETGALYDVQYNFHYEPYVVGHRHGIPRYWDPFRGYHFTKYSWFAEANLMGSKFAVLRNYFVYHLGNSVHTNTGMPLETKVHWNKFQLYIWGKYNVSIKAYPLGKKPKKTTKITSKPSATSSDKLLVTSGYSVELQNAWNTLLVKNSSSPTVHLKMPKIIQRRKAIESDDITLRTHASAGRLNQILTQVDRWSGPVSAAIYLTNKSEVILFLDFVNENAARLLEKTEFHVFLEHSKSSATPEYPYNILRNILLAELETKYFLAMDAGFVTEKDCYEKLISLIRGDPKIKSALDAKTLLVLPAFEQSASSPTEGFITPETKLQAIDMSKRGWIVPAQLAGFPQGHGPTNFEKWYQNSTSAIYDIPYSLKFEPYVLGRKDGLPRYWESFRGYFFDKYSFFIEANFKGFKFAVLRDTFVFHAGRCGMDSMLIPEAKKLLWIEFEVYISKTYGVPAAWKQWPNKTLGK